MRVYCELWGEDSVELTPEQVADVRGGKGDYGWGSVYYYPRDLQPWQITLVSHDVHSACISQETYDRLFGVKASSLPLIIAASLLEAAKAGLPSNYVAYPGDKWDHHVTKRFEKIYVIPGEGTHALLEAALEVSPNAEVIYLGYEEDEPDIKPGDVVRLKSGGPPMTVECFDTEGEVVCMWFALGIKDIYTFRFSTTVLEKVKAHQTWKHEHWTNRTPPQWSHRMAPRNRSERRVYLHRGKTGTSPGIGMMSIEKSPIPTGGRSMNCDHWDSKVRPRGMRQCTRCGEIFKEPEHLRDTKASLRQALADTGPLIESRDAEIERLRAKLTQIRGVVDRLSPLQSIELSWCAVRAALDGE